MSSTATRAPAAWSDATVAAPIPLAPPVTIAHASTRSIAVTTLPRRSAQPWTVNVQSVGEPWFGIYLPQLRMSFDRILERTLAAEAAGFDSVWLMDHFTAPAAPEVDTFEGFTVATALAARTSTIRIGHLVLCDPFRHPVLLAKMAATLDVISGGRLELGIGWGSVPAELETYGFGPEPPAVRAAKLRETLEILELMFAGETFDYDGVHYQLRACDRAARAAPSPGAGAHRWGRTEAHDAARGEVRRLVELPGIRAPPDRRAPTAGRCRADLDPASDRPRGRRRDA